MIRQYAARFGAGSALARHFGWMFLGDGLQYLLRGLYFVLIARLLGANQYGVLVGAIALAGMTANYGRLGSSIVFMRYVSADRSRAQAYWGNVLLSTLGMGSLLTLALSLTANYLIGKAAAALIVPTAIAMCLCEQLTVGIGQVFQTFEKMRTTATLNLLTSAVRLLAAAVMLNLWHRATASQWAYASMVVSIGATIIALMMVTRTIGLPKFEPWLALQRSVEGTEYAVSASATTAYNDLDKAMLSHYGMNTGAGIYTIAYRAIDLATSPSGSIERAAEPRLFQLGASSLAETAAFGKRLLLRSALVSLGLSVALFLFSPLLPVVMGKSFSEAVVAMRWLCLIPLFRSIHGITGMVLTSAGKQRYRSATQLISVALNFGLNLFLIPRYGWLGAAWASLSTDATLGLMNGTILQHLLRKGTRAPNSEVVMPVLSQAAE